MARTASRGRTLRSASGCTGSTVQERKCVLNLPKMAHAEKLSPWNASTEVCRLSIPEFVLILN